MKHAIYPGSFNPWHEGHTDILNKALQVFDQVLVLQCINPEKQNLTPPNTLSQDIDAEGFSFHKVKVRQWGGLLVDAIYNWSPSPIAIIRGLRNGHDLQYEMNQQYWLEDLGLKIPVVYFITDRNLAHISSSAIRAIEAFKDK